MLSSYLRATAFGISMAFALVLGLSFSIKSWDGMVYFYTSQDSRSPAAIRRVFDFSHLSGRALVTASQERIIDEARVLLKDSEVGVELGHFVTRDKFGSKEFACQTYDQIELHFSSAEFAQSGMPASMIVRGPCRVGKDINRIDPIWIPVQKILEQKVGNVELQFMDEHPVSLRFENVGSEWPVKWNLDSVRLYNSKDNSQMLSVDRQEVERLARNPLVLSWTTGSPAN